MKIGPVTNNSNGDVMSKNCNVIIIFPIFDQFGAFKKPDSG